MPLDQYVTLGTPKFRRVVYALTGVRRAVGEGTHLVYQVQDKLLHGTGGCILHQERSDVAAVLFTALFQLKVPLAGEFSFLPVMDAWEWKGHLANPQLGESTVGMSKGFASFFTSDTYLQNLLSYIISPLFLILAAAFITWLIYRLVRRYDRKMKSEIAQGQQLLLFKAKQMGLTDYQFKILKGITDMLHLEKPSLIMDDEHQFERSIRPFLRFAAAMGEGCDTVESICKDLIITYEKIYHHTDMRKPLAALTELEINSLVLIGSEDGSRFIAKLKGVERDKLVLHPILSAEEAKILQPGLGVSLYFWRAGDAEYDFSSVLVGFEKGLIDILIPGEFHRGQPVPFPLTNVMIPCTVAAENSQDGISADIFKLNETEAVIRCSDKFSHDHPYILSFTLADFDVKITVQVLREHYINDRHIFYSNLKFTTISDAAKTVISSYITEHLFE